MAKPKVASGSHASAGEQQATLRSMRSQEMTASKRRKEIVCTLTY